MDEEDQSIKWKGKIDLQHCLQSEAAIKEIISPLLEIFPLTQFHHMRVFEDGSHFSFTDRVDFLEWFYQQWFPNANVFQNNFEHFQTQVFPWSILVKKYATEEVKGYVEHASDAFNISNGITIIKKSEKFCDFFHFGAGRDNFEAEYDFLAKIDLLDQLIYYYIDRAQELLKKATENRTFTVKHKVDVLEANQVENDLRIECMKSMKVKRYYVDNTYFTSKEIACLRWLAMGKTADEIAIIEGNTKRTVEHHIQNMKAKTNCQKITTLVLKAQKWGLVII